MTRLSTIRQVIGLAGWLLLSFAAAGVGAVASVRAVFFINSSYVQSGLHLHGFLVQCGASYIYSWESLPGLYGDNADFVNPVWRFGYLSLN
jgi:hypothetical protein